MAEHLIKKIRIGNGDDVYTFNASYVGDLSAADIQEKLAGLEDLNALVYRGAIAGGDSPLEGGTLTPEANAGDVYKVSKAGYINGAKVDAGDMLICNTDDTPAATTDAPSDAHYQTVADRWDIIQGNIDSKAILDHTHTLPDIEQTGHSHTFTVSSSSQSLQGGIAKTGDQDTLIIGFDVDGTAPQTFVWYVGNNEGANTTDEAEANVSFQHAITGTGTVSQG